MDTISLKKYIFDNQKIDYVLEKLNCHHITFHNKHDYFSACFPDGDNLQGINIRNNEYLNYRSFSRCVDYEDNKDIISLVEYIKNCSFIEAVKYLHGILDLEYKWQRKPQKSKDKVDPLYIFKKWQDKKRRVDVDDIHVLDEELLNDYVPLLHIDWFKFGIMPWARDRFGLAYSWKRKRVIVPHRYWLTGELLGINARTTVENWEELGIKKYFLTSGYNKSLNVYGYWENHEDIEQLKYCTLFESEKSVLKRFSLNDHSGLALSGKSISDEQVRIILSLNIQEIVIALDNDVPIEEVWHICEKFYNVRKVSYIRDSHQLLGKKDAPADANNKIYNFLFKYRVVYDTDKHKQYLKSLEKG